MKTLLRCLSLCCAMFGLGAAAQTPELGQRTPRTSLERQEIRAQLTPRRHTTIASEIGAKVASIPLPEGSGFRAGQTLIQFDCSVQQANLKKVEAELDAATHTLNTNLRLKELNSVGQLDLDLSQTEVNKYQADVGAHKAILAKCKILAPFGGRIAEQRVREQQFVQPGQALLDILDDSVLELEFLVPSSWLRWLKTQHKFDVRIDETGQNYPARVTRIGARVDPVSQSVKVTAAIQGQHRELIAGMSGKVQITPPNDSAPK